MAYAIGLMLPIILIIGGGIWLLMSITEDSKNKRNIKRISDENARVTKEYFNMHYSQGSRHVF